MSRSFAANDEGSMDLIVNRYWVIGVTTANRCCHNQPKTHPPFIIPRIPPRCFLIFLNFIASVVFFVASLNPGLRSFHSLKPGVMVIIRLRRIGRFFIVQPIGSFGKRKSAVFIQDDEQSN